MPGLLKTDAGDIRYIWKISLTLVLLILFIVISRILLILAVEQIFILQGIGSNVAFQNSQIFVSESSEGQALASLLDLVLIILLIYLLITRLEKREFQLSDLGLSLRQNTLFLVGLGFVIGCILYFGTIFLGILLDVLEFSIIPDLSMWPLSSLFTSIAFYVFNSFWQEVLFRGYLQTRAVEEFGRCVGVILVTVIFVVFHGLVQSLTPIGILTGILLFLFIGLLYDKSKSLYLVGVIHAVLNFLPVLYNTWLQGLETITIYSIGLILLLLFLYQTEKKIQIDSISV